MTDDRLFDPAGYGARSARTRRPGTPARAVQITRDWVVLRRLESGPLAHLRKGDGVPNDYGAVRAECGAVGLPLSGVEYLTACDSCEAKAIKRGLLWPRPTT